MRMWNVNPKMMCDKHLLGEHVEMHMFIGSIRKGINLQGFLDNQLVEIHNLKNRHDILAAEMQRRGFNHRSELPKMKKIVAGYVDIVGNEKELQRRCNRCKINFLKNEKQTKQN